MRQGKYALRLNYKDTFKRAILCTNLLYPRAVKGAREHVEELTADL